MPRRLRTPVALAVLALAACNDHPTDGGYYGGEPGQPTDVRARYEWILQGWTAQGRPSGRPSVVVTWRIPTGWNNEPFAVYSRRAGQSSFSRIATVTSCQNGTCRYVDVNVSAGAQYEYYTATVDERSGRERVSDVRDAVTVPAATVVPTPQADSVFALDNANYLRWRSGGASGALWKYQVFLVAVNGSAVDLYQLGETDGTGFLDQRARNGRSYTYRVAAVDTLGHYSDMSGSFTGTPRPDFRGELIYAHGDSTPRSGFRFVDSDASSPIVAGDASNAQWRFEVVNGAWQIRPLGETEVVDAGRTTALVCEPARDPGCRAVYQAPTSGYTRNPVPVNSEFSYVFRVRASNGRIHHGVVRPVILGTSQGKRLMIFDWAYQLVPDETRLLKRPG